LVRVVFSKTVYLDTEERARAFAARLVLKPEREGSVLRLSTNREELARHDDVGFETGFDIQVPPDTAVSVRNEHGGVDLADVAGAEVESSYDALRVARVAGPADLKNRHGDVHVSEVKGALALLARYGDVEVQDLLGRATLDVQHGKVSVERVGSLNASLAHSDLSAEGIGGDLEVKGEHAAVQASDVTGSAKVQTSFDGVSLVRVGGDARIKTDHGEIKATEVKGALWAQASFARVELQDIGGPAEVTVEHGGLEARGLGKGARVKASGDDIALDGFQGPLEIVASRGNLRLSPKGALTDSVSASITHGAIHLEVSPGSHFELEARARRGEIQVNVPGFTTTHSEAERVTGTLGEGGSPVRLATDGGDLSVTARAATAAQGR